MTMLQGADISTYQGRCDFAALKPSVSFLYAKATEGANYVDDSYPYNAATAHLRGIPFGAYHFFRFGEDPTQQAEHFLHASCFKKGDYLVPMVDVEANDDEGATMDVADRIAALATFNKIVEAASGKLNIIYTMAGFWDDPNTMAGSADFSGHPLWVANFANPNGPALPQGWNEWLIWQYNDEGQLPGIEGYVDLDQLNSNATLEHLLT